MLVFGVYDRPYSKDFTVPLRLKRLVKEHGGKRSNFFTV